MGAETWEDAEQMDQEPEAAAVARTPLEELAELAVRLRREEPERQASRPGGLLAQGWETLSRRLAMPMVCVHAAGRCSPLDTHGIPVAVELPVADIIRRFWTLLGGVRPVLLVHDGVAGNFLQLLELVDDRIVYADPTPGETTLREGQNAAGVAAEEYGRGKWAVRPYELERVLVGVLVQPSRWFEVYGDGGAVRYQELADTDLWRHFQLREVSRDGEEVTVLAGDFQNSVVLRFFVGGRGRIRLAELWLRSEWAVLSGRRANPFGLEIAKAFGQALTPKPDRAAAEEALSGLRPSKTLADREFDPATPAGQLDGAYTGEMPDFWMDFQMSALELRRDRGWQVLAVHTF